MRMTALEWLPILTLGALAGAAGQAARTIPGIKKLSDEAAAKGTTTAALLVPSQLVTSLMIGAVAGLLGTISLQGTSGMEFTTKDILMLAAIGYAGADFIEAFVQKQFPSGREPSTTASSTAGPATPAGGAVPAAPNPAIPSPATLGVGPRIDTAPGTSQAVG
jgi:hypothetical protein